MRRMRVLAALALLTAAPAQAGEPVEKVLLKGTTGRTVPTYSRVRRPYQPWKIDWDNYLYRDFYALISDEQLAARPKGGPPREVKLIAHGPGEAAIAAADLVRLRFFGDEKTRFPTNPTYVAMGDWRGWRYVRMDVKFSTDVHVWWALEDKHVQPPVTANFDVKADTWTTLQVDLAEAARQRKLDLSEMWLTWVRTNAPVGCRIERGNIRLAKADAAAKYPILTDPDAAKLPPHPKRVAPPTPDLPRDTTPLKRPRTLVYRSRTRIGMRGIYRQLYGFANAYDAKRMMLVLADGSYDYVSRRDGKPLPRRGEADRWEGFAVQTLDGGKTWTGLDGDAGQSWLYVSVGHQFEVVDRFGGAILTNENGCGNNPGPRQRITKFTFRGKAGWTCNRKDYVLNEESRHCSHGGPWFDATRLPGGRIWSVLYVEGRLRPNGANLHAKYSDSDGRAWHTWKEGVIARIPGADVKSEGSNPQIVPYGDHVAVLWTSVKAGSRWTHYDGKKWSAPRPVAGRIKWALATGVKEIVAYSWAWRGAGGKAIAPGPVRLAGDKWVPEKCPRAGAHSQASLSGKSIMWVSVAADKISVLRRSPDGVWHGPQVFTAPGKVHSWTVPRYSPPTFTPILYMTDADEKEARILLVPNPDAGGV